MSFVTVGWLKQTGIATSSDLHPELEIGRVTLDSRAVRPGDTFWAVKSHRDGHEFVEAAFSNGARTAIVNSSWTQTDSGQRCKAKCLTVHDTTAALSQLGKLWRESFRGEVVGITGSNGKTSTKDLMLRVLETKFATDGTVGNLNNHFGVPLTLLNLPNHLERYVIEMGASFPGEIGGLCEIAVPDHGLVTSISSAHIGGFGTLEELSHTKGQLYDFVARRGISFVPVNDARCRIESARSSRRVGYGFGVKPADWHDEFYAGEDLSISGNACAAFSFEGTKIQLSVPGKPSALSALAALSVASKFGVAIDDAARAVHKWNGVPGRAQFTRAGNLGIYDDSYNANPASMRAALETLAATDGKRKIAILGSMSELGEFTDSEHLKLLESVLEYELKRVVLVGSEWPSPTMSGGTQETDIHYFISVDELLPDLQALLTDCDLVLLKGSRSARLERAVSRIRELFG